MRPAGGITTKSASPARPAEPRALEVNLWQSHAVLRVVPADEPLVLEVALPPFRLEAGAPLLRPRARIVFWGTKDEQAALARDGRLEAVDPSRPTVCILPTLTSDLDPRASFPELFGRSRPLRPWAQRLVAVSLLGSEHDPSGPAAGHFPSRDGDVRFPRAEAGLRGAATRRDDELPATVTTWDQARALRLTLDALGLRRVHTVFGASIGGMVALAYAALAGDDLERACVVACPFVTSAATLAHDHLVREVLLSDRDYPHGTAMLGLARQVALFGYRGRGALEARQGRETAGPRHAGPVRWNPRAPYRIETYFRHLGEGPHRDARATIALLGAMDHHDLAREPPFAFRSGGGAMIDRVHARVTCVAVSSDTFVTPEEVRALATRLGDRATYREIESDYGHDGFLVERVKLARILHAVLTERR